MARPAWLDRLTRVQGTTVADVAGASLLSAGAALIYVPAGLIVAGLLVLAASWSAADRKDDAP